MDHNDKLKLINEELKYIPDVLQESKKFLQACMVMNAISNCNEDIRRHSFDVNGKNWVVFETQDFKVIREMTDYSYNEFYDYKSGYTIRFGKTADDDPVMCSLGNTIADIEVVSGKCPKINGKNCKFCYKSNGGDVATCMMSIQAERLLDFINENKQLQQVAFGITGFYTNPDFEHILKICKDKHITPNYTTNGADIDDHAIDVTLKNCGRVAVSCYEGAKELCYSTIKRFGDAAEKAGIDFKCNIHVVLSKDTYRHVMEVLRDAADNKIDNLGAVVMLRLKNVGRAKILDPSLPDEMYENIIKFCLDRNVKFGFDSCGCHRVEDIFKKLGRQDLISSIEPCESSRFSGYFNVKSKYYNCSFCEQLDDHDEIDPYSYKSYSEFWHSDAVRALRFPKDGWACKSCPFMHID